MIISEFKTKKVSYINEHGKLNISFDVKSEGYDLVNVSVVTDEEYVNKVYTYMIETNNAYFKDGTDGLCVIKFEKK